MAQEPAWLSQSSKVDSDSWLDQVSKPVEPSQAKKDLPLIDITDIASSLGETVTSLPTTVTASLGQMYEGTMNPWEKGAASIERQKEMRDVQREAKKAQAEAEASGEASVFSRAIRSGIPSYGFTGAIVPPSLVAGGVASLATAAATRSPVAAQRAGMAAGTAASGYASYRMAASQFLDDARERIDNFFLEKAGRLPNKQEQDEAYQELLPLAQEMGLAEALPEAFGNLALAGAGKYIYRILGGKTGVQQLASGALSKVKGMNALKAVGAGAAGAGTEVGTEAVTDVLQESPYKKLEEGIMRGQPVEAVEIPPFTLERFKQGVERVAEPTLATTALFGLAGAGIGMGVRRATREDFSQDEFRDKMTKQAESAEKQLSSPDITPAQRKFLADKVEESNAALKALDEGRSSDVEKYFNVRFTKAEELSMPDPDEVAVQLNTDAAKSLEAAGSPESAKAQAGFDATLKGILGPPTEPTPPTLEEREEVAPIISKVEAINKTKKELDQQAKSLGYDNARQMNLALATKEDLTEEQRQVLDSYGNLNTEIRNLSWEDASKTSEVDFSIWSKARFTPEIKNDNDRADMAQLYLALNQRGDTEKANLIFEEIKNSKRKTDWTVESWFDRFPNDPASQNEIDAKNKDNILWNEENDVLVKELENARDSKISPASKIISATPPSPQIEEKVPSIVGGDFFVTPGKFYRIIVGDEAFQDIIDTGLVRTNSKSKIQESAGLAEKLKERPTAFPSFSKDKASMIYARENPDHYIIVSESDTLKPSTRARHGKGSTHFPTDEKGQPLKSLPASETVVYKHIGNGKYKRVFVGSDFAQITPSPKMEQAAAPAVEEPTLTPEPKLYAPAQVPSEESVYEEPQDRVKGREAEETSLGDRLLRPEEGEVKEEVMPSPEVAADPFAATPLVDNLPALIAVRDNNATPEQVQSLVDQGLVEQVDGQNIITEAGVAAMPEDQRPKLTPAERAAEVKGMGVPVERDVTKAEYYKNAIASDEARVAEIDAAIKDWSSRVYKQTKGTLEIDDKSPSNLYGVREINLGKTNERKRAARIRGLESEKEQLLSKIRNDKRELQHLEEQTEIRRAQSQPQAPKYETLEQLMAEAKNILGTSAEVKGMAAPVAEPSVTTPAKAATVKSTELRVGDEVSFKGNTYRVKKILSDGRVRAEFTNPEGIARIPKGSENITTLPRNVNFTRIEKPTPDSVAVEPGATRGVQAEPVGGSIPTVGEVSPETEISSRENLGPEVAAAEQKQAAADEAAKKRQKKQDESTKNSLNSILDPQKKNAVTGTVTKADVETAREALTNSGEIPNAYLTNVYESLEAFLADKANARLFPSAYTRLQTEKNIEGLYENGQTLIFAKQIQVSNLDRNLAKMLGITPEQAAARRVIAHENGHKAISLFTMAEKRELRGYLMRAYSDEQIAKLVEKYTEYADWRTNPESRLEALEELLMRDFERMDKIPTGGVWDDIVQFLKRVWRRLTGQKGEPTLKNLKDVARLMRNAMKRPAVALGSFTLKDGGKVKLSFIGEKAIENLPEERRQFMRDSLDTAKAMAAAGKDSEEIRAVTGWFPGKYDGKMRWEVPDEGAKLTSAWEELKESSAFGPKTSIGLDAVIDHPELFTAYPELADVAVSKQRGFFDIFGAMQGWFNPDANTLNVTPNADEPLSTILHEIQHWIQKKEGFAKGSNTEAAMKGLSPSQKQKTADQMKAKAQELIAREEKNISSAEAILSTLESANEVEFDFLLEAVDKAEDGFLNAQKEFGTATPQSQKAYELLKEAEKNLLSSVGIVNPLSNWDVAYPIKTAQSFDKLKSDTLKKRDKARETIINHNNLLTSMLDNDEQFEKAVKAFNLAYELYKNVAGEIEARDVQARKDLTPEQRAATAPYSSENIAPEDAIVMFGDAGAQMSMAAPEMDAEYLAAVEAGDMEKAQRMVDEAAKAAGYDREAFKAMPVKDWRTDEPINVINSTNGPWAGFFTDTKDVADRFGRIMRQPVRRAFLKLAKPFEVDASGKAAGELQFDILDDSRPYAQKNNAEILAAINSGKYDAIVLNNTTDEGTVIVPLGPSQIKSADPVTRDDNGNVIPLSQRFQPTSPDIRFSRPQFASDTDAATSAGNEAARSTIYSERDMDVREAIRRAYEAMPKDTSVAVPIGELFAKTEELLPDVTQDEFSNVLQDLFEDNGAVLQEGDVVEPLTEQDRRYLTLAEDEEANREELQRMVDEAAKKVGATNRLQHWTNSDTFTRFDPIKIGTGQRFIGTQVNGFWFNDANGTRSPFGSRKIEAFLILKNPKIFESAEAYDAASQGFNSSEEFTSNLVGQGYDGVIIKPAEEWMGSQEWDFTNYVAFNPSQIKSADPVTRDDQGRIIPLSRRFDTGADIRGQINVTTPEGRRAGFVVVMPRAAKASKIPIEDAEEASKSFKVDLAEAGKGRVDKKAKFKGIPLKDTEIPEHNVKSYVLYRDSAIKLIDDLMAKTNDILVVAEALQDPEFQIAIGLQVSKDVSSDMITIARNQIGIEIENRLANEIRKERNPRRKRELELAEKRGIIYYNAGTGAGQALQNRQESLTDPRYRGRNLFNQAKLQKEQKAKDKLDAITGGTEKITDIITGVEQKAAEETTQAEVEAQESAVEDDEYAKLVSEGEEGLEGRRKTIWERAKMILRRLAMYARADKLDIKEGSKASLSAEQRKELDELNAILRMPKAERDKAREKDLAEFDALMTEFLGLESEAKTPEQKKTRKKREKMVNTAKKRAEAGKSLETPQEGEVESSEEQVSKAERTAQAILKDLSERYSDPLIIKEKKPNVDAMRELYKERVKQGVGPNQMTEKSFVNKAVELGADETTAGILWKAAELEIDAREAMRQDKILQRKAAVGARADAQAHRIIFAKERLKRQSGFAGIDTNPNKDTIIQAFRDQVKNPVNLEDFVARLKSLNVRETVAKRLFTAAEREKADLEAMEAFKALEGPDALKRMLNEMNKARPADSVPLERAMPWRKILSSNPKDVAEYRQRIFEAISDLPSFQNLTDEQKERLADLYAEAWENRKQAILDRMLRDEIKKARDRDEISEDVEKKLQQSRNKILEIVNLGGFNNDDLVKILGERYGISTSFTEEQKERIQKLADQLQDEDMNTAKRNKLAMEFAVELAGAMDVPVSEIISNWWTSSVLFGPQTIFSIGAAFLNGGYSIATIGTRRMLAKLFKGDIQGAIEESILMLKGFARYLGAFKQSGRRAWNYLWTGDVGLLGTGSTDILSEINNFDQLQRFQRHKLLAEKLAKDPRMVRRYVGVYLRFVSRLLTALDAFNVMVTKAGTASLALRMSGMSTDKIIEAEKMLNLKAYKDQVIRDYFDNKAPKTQAEKALVDSYAEAEMYRAINKLGGKMENADYLASESAMTMHPTGFGGVVYDAITGFFAQRQSNADEYLEKMKKDWISNKDLKAVTFLALAYLRQFAAYNAAGLTGSKFVRYASNKFNQGLSFIPFAGLLRQIEAKDDRIKGKDAFRETIYRNQIVSFVMLMVGYSVIKAIQDEPDDEERGNFWNGGWSNLTPDQKKQMLAKGQKEYTMGFKFNGRWYVFNYQNWPLNQILSAIGSMSDQIRFSPEKWDEKSALSKGVAGMVSGVKSTLEIPALSGLQELVGNRLASKDPTEKDLDRLSRVASGWVGGFVPRILKDIDFYTQPELRKYEGLWEKTASHIPIYRRYIGEEYYDILGKQIKRNVIPGSREFMMGPTEPEYKILGALNARNIFLTPANAEYRMVGKGRNRRRLTQEEADAYSLETGRGYRDMLLRYGQRALQMPTERARAFLQDKAEEVRDRALKRAYRR